jgi:hypothetical protein
MLTKMKYALIAPVVLGTLTVLTSSIAATAQNGPQDYRYCALDKGGGTTCYFNSREACSASGNGRCMENPLYTGAGDAFAREPRSHDRAPRR